MNNDIKKFDATGRDLWPDSQIQEELSKYSPVGRVKHIAAPPLRVTRLIGGLGVVDRGQLREEDTRRAPGTWPRMVGINVSKIRFNCQAHALAVNISDEDAANADDGWSLGKTYGVALVDKMATAAEPWLRNAVNSSTNVNTGVTVASAWNGTGTTSNPVANIRTALEHVQDTTGQKPNIIIAGRTADRILRAHSYTNFASGGYATGDRMPKLFDVSTYVVAGAFTDVAEGFSGNPSFLIDDQIIMVVQAPPTRWAATVYWSPTPEASQPGQWIPYLHPHDPLTKSRMLEVCDWSDTVVIDPMLAVTISGVGSSQSGGI